jgi:hypothetical protein
MFLTTAEATWIGVGIGGVLGGVNGRLVLIATRRKDHQQRLWDRTADLYEHVLFEVGSLAAARDKVMRIYRLSRPDREIPTLDEAERERTLIRLEMFGHRDIRDAFERCVDAHNKWRGCALALQAVFERNAEITKLQIPEEQTSSEEVKRLKNERNTANQVADEQHDELRRAIQAAVRRVPKPDRWFRRAPHAVGRRIRDARRYSRASLDERRRRRRLRDQ